MERRVCERDDETSTALYAACATPQHRAAAVLVACGADIEAIYKDDEISTEISCLSAACRAQSLDTVKLLLRSGADVNRADKNGVKLYLALRSLFLFFI